VFPQSLWVIGLMIVVLIGLYFLVNRTRVGKQMTATANDAGAASLSGVNTGRMILLAFGISAAIGALGGIAVTPINSTNYLSGGLYALSGFVAAILGGWGSSAGAVVGGLALGIIQSLATGFLPAGYQDAIAYAILILVLYFRPSGLLGTYSAEGEAQ
jgi:branched-chain amino acid transport system permease protein